MTEDLTIQDDELSAIAAIFGEDWICENESNRVYSIELKKGPSTEGNCDHDNGQFIRLGIKLPSDYPSNSPPTYEISAPWMSRKLKTQMISDFDHIYTDNRGECIIYLWIEKAKEYLFSDDLDTNNDTDQNLIEESDFYEQGSMASSQSEPSEVEIIHGESLKDRKSVFQAHVARVSNVDQVNQVVETLKGNKKIATATHNIVAYRILTPPNDVVLQDCDDDGETHAGSRLLHLLQILDAKNVVVVVSRWFGGIQLGPDRFKHINNVARDLLDQSGFLPTTLPSKKSNKKSK